MTFQWINFSLSLVIGGILAYKLGWLSQRFSGPEMVGMGFIGAGAILTIGPLLWPGQSPYENWSGTLLRIGLCTYFVGRLIRYDLGRRR